MLRASCHIPVLGGLLPFRIGTAEGEEVEAHPHQGAKGSKGKGARYYDGLFWPSVLWSWRAFNASDTLLKASGLGYPNPDPNPYPNPCPNPNPNPNPCPTPKPEPSLICSQGLSRGTFHFFHATPRGADCCI